MNKKHLLLSIPALMAVSSLVFADTDTGTLNVTATVAAKCKIISGGNLAFPDFDPTSGNASDGVAQMSVRCTKGVASTIYISNPRTMTDGADTLIYQLYSNAGRTTVWGDTLGTGEPYTAATSAPANIDVYGRIPSTGNDNAGAGSYTGNATVTIEW